MTIPRMLVDSSFLYELYDQSAPNHDIVRLFVNFSPAQMLVPEVILTETAFLFQRGGCQPRAPSSKRSSRHNQPFRNAILMI